ncbi:Do family serine endopeptidase [Uliginosibacterium sp. TH139]|uniref:Do family serine endopeptidase n=1 Tax=Uliginosibacterium sp. TH139 TaxID=2067453 RepID=UPI000C7B2991|nr:Do family serine endopeptidase [Uliginosibacterium sp. TH139]PLK49717.1 2-alkenal reductase [Uliginosibacterium sp. TH139]
MQRLWLIFAQTATIALGVLFVITTLKPEWVSRPTLFEAPPAALESSAQTPPGPVRAADSYANAAQAALPAVVHIFTSKEIEAPRHPLFNDPFFRHFFGAPERTPQRSSGLGSGVMVSGEGYILTNNHVIEAADTIEVALNDGQKYRARIVGRDPETDLAVLRIDSKTALHAISFAAADSVRVGDVVLAIGNPFGVGQTVTMGIVSALGRSDLGINTFENFIQTDAAINPGNSGGALVDTRGQLVGINTAIYSRSGGSLGIGFAIPAGTARSIMEQIIKNGQVTRGWIGIQVQEITPELAQALQLPQKGALIAGIARNSPAAKGGLQAGDVLIALDGKAINNAHGVLETVASLPPGQLAKAAIIRKGKTMEAVLQIAQRPLPTQSAQD